jgi:hypothetical protein
MYVAWRVCGLTQREIGGRFGVGGCAVSRAVELVRREIPVPRGLDGESVLFILRGKETAPRIAFAENMLFAEERTALRTQSHKYVRWADGREEVYDLASDPAERVNLDG